MAKLSHPQHGPHKIRNGLLRLAVASARLRTEVRGVAAVEFAFLAPIMILLLVGTIELSAGVSVDRKLSRASSTISDLITQSDSLTTAEVDAIIDVAAKVLYPYSDQVTIIVTGITIDKFGVATVSWSRSEPAGNEKTVGSSYPVPADIVRNKSFLVSAKVTTSYSPSFGWASYSTPNGLSFSTTAIDMEEELFTRPRIGSDVILN
jgi:Flp pilus assembly protein TadG